MDTASQEQAIQLASVVWNTPVHEIGDSVPAELLQELDSEGIIDQDDGKWRFAPAEMLFYLRAIDLIDSLALHSRQSEEVLRELEQFIDSARDDSINGFRDYRQVVSFVLAELVNKHGREDLLESAISEGIQEQQFWRFYDMVCSSLPILEISVQNLAKILKVAERRAKGDLAGGRAYAAVEHLGRLRPNFAFQLVDHLVGSPDKISAGFLERLLTGIAKSSPENFDVVKARCGEHQPLSNLGDGKTRLVAIAIYISDNTLRIEGRLSLVNLCVRPLAPGQCSEKCEWQDTLRHVCQTLNASLFDTG